MTMNLPNLLILILACYRLSSLIASEAGPGQILVRFRHFCGVRYDELSRPFGINGLAEGLLCTWCNSIWIGLILAGLYFWQPTLTLGLCLPLALSAGAILIGQPRKAG